MKRPRYSDVYTDAYQSRDRGALGAFVESAIKRFRRKPAQLISVPQYIDTVYRTQSIAERQERPDTLAWALRVVHFLRQRAANIITRQALHYLYNPNGPWLCRKLVDYQNNGLATF